jgi:hypothetical protein
MSDPLLKPFKKEQLPIVSHPGYWRQTLPGTGDDSTEVQYEDWRKGKVLGSVMYGTVRLIRSVQDEKKVRAVKEVFKKKTKTIRVIQELQALVTLKKVCTSIGNVIFNMGVCLCIARLFSAD